MSFTTKLVVLSDTHISKKAKQLPSHLVKDLETADMIIHAGDWKELTVYHQLAQYSEVIGVAGNVDGPDIVEKFGLKKTIGINGFKIGIVHGHGSKQTTEKRALAAFENDQVDVIIYGHSHVPVNKLVNGLILFNPGSPTGKRRQAQVSYGIIEIEGENLQLEHVFFNDKT